MTKLNKKVFAFIVMTVSMLLLAPLVNAQPETVTVWTDKHEYSPGQTGKLYVAYNNVRKDPVTIRNITVVFSQWCAYVNDAWVGNLTYKPSENEKTIAEYTTRVFEISFTVPSDGRARWTDAEIKVYTNLGYDQPSSDPTISVFETPVYMEQIITLFTIQVVLLIVCTIIIAATIFLSARRPQVTWRPQEKTE